MKNLTQATFYLFGLLALSFLFTQCKDAKDTAVTKLLEAQVKVVNNQCPIQVNASVRIDSAQISDKMTLKTFATVAYINAADFNKDEFVKLSKPGLLYNIQTASDLKTARELGVIFVYSYNDDSGKLLGEIKITPDDYNQPIDENQKGDLASMAVNDVDNLLQKVVSGIKPHLPMQVDGVTTLTECKALPDKTLEYIYTINATKKEMGPDFAKNMEAQLKQIIVSTPETKQMVDAGVTLYYIYNDKNGAEICNIKLKADDIK